MDRNSTMQIVIVVVDASLSARRAWIEIILPPVDTSSVRLSLSARRAWIEMESGWLSHGQFPVALRKESVDRNIVT